MNDAMDAVKSYLSAGHVLLRGKRLLVYACLIIITIAGMVPTTIKLMLDPDVKTVLPSTVSSVYELADMHSVSPRRTSQQGTEFKSQGQILGERITAERAASRKTMMKSVGILIDWIYAAIIGDILLVGLYSIYIRLAKREVGFKDLFNGFTSGNYINTVIALLLKKGIIQLISMISLIVLALIPGAFVVALVISIAGTVLSYALFMVEFIMADDPSISFIRAFQISIKASSGYKLPLFLINLFTVTIPQILGGFTAVFICARGILDNNAEKVIQSFFVALGIALFLALIRPVREGAFAAAYEDAKMSGKNYGYISQFEFYDPEDQIDNNDDSGMMFFG